MSVTALKEQVRQLIGQKKYAWCHYFNTTDHLMTHIMDQQYKIMMLNASIASANNNNDIPQHLLTMITDLHTANNKLLECPICFNTINKTNVTSSKCGHLICKSCMDKLKKEPIEKRKCAVCRKSL